MKKQVFFFGFLFFGLLLQAQRFKAIIEFRVTQDGIADRFVWYVNSEHVRIDQFDRATGTLKASTIVNTDGQKSGTYVDHVRKVWYPVTGSLNEPPKYAVSTTDSTKNFFRKECTKQVVTLEDSTSFSYWLTSDSSFRFFNSSFGFTGGWGMMGDMYWFLPMDLRTEGMPMMVTKRNARGQETGRCEVVRFLDITVDERTVNRNLFVIPDGYKKAD